MINEQGTRKVCINALKEKEGLETFLTCSAPSCRRRWAWAWGQEINEFWSFYQTLQALWFYVLMQ